MFFENKLNVRGILSSERMYTIINSIIIYMDIVVIQKWDDRTFYCWFHTFLKIFKFFKKIYSFQSLVWFTSPLAPLNKFQRIQFKFNPWKCQYWCVVWYWITECNYSYIFTSLILIIWSHFLWFNLSSAEMSTR